MPKSTEGRGGCLTFSRLIRYTTLMSSILNSLSAAQLKRAVAIKEQIEELETKLSGILGEAPKAAPIAAPKKRTMSAAARAKISAAQKARHAARRAAAPQKGGAAVSKRK